VLVMLEAPLIERRPKHSHRIASLWHEMTRRKALADTESITDQSDSFALASAAQ